MCILRIESWCCWVKKNINLNKTAVSVIIFNVTQIVILIYILVYGLISNKLQGVNIISLQSLIYIIVVLVAILNSFIIFRELSIISEMQRQWDILKDTFGQVENLNNTLRAQRHDFLNHLQVIFGLIELEEYNDANEYIHKVFNDIQKVSKVIKTISPAINALLQAKVLHAEKLDIDVKLNITSQLRDLPIPPWEMCRVLGNIIDNAIDALRGFNCKKNIIIDIFEDLKSYGFKVINTGNIDEGLKEKIFQYGFTTKGEKGEGMGLGIAKEILESHNGKIKAYNRDNTTVFEVNILKGGGL